jgi:hypothetical protein
MNRRFHYQATMRLIISWVLIALLPICQAQAQQTPHLTKHAKKIHKTLAKYPTGSLLHIFLLDHTDKFGHLGTLSETSFEFTDADTAVTTSINYDEVDRVTPGAPSVQAGIGGTARHHGSRGFLIIVGVAAAAAVGIIAASRN